MAMRASFWEDILRAAGGESIEAVVIGAAGGYGDPQWKDDRGVPKDQRGVILTPDEAAKWLEYAYDDGFGGADCHSVCVWTASKVIFVAEYDGSTSIATMPRNPVAHWPQMV